MKYLKKALLACVFGVLIEVFVFNIDYWCKYFTSQNDVEISAEDMMAGALEDYENVEVQSGGLIYIPSEAMYVRNVIAEGQDINSFSFVYTDMSGKLKEINGDSYQQNLIKFSINDRINGITALKNNSAQEENKNTIKVVFNSTEMNFSIWRVLAILIVYEGFSLLFLIQAPINYHLEETRENDGED